jgi:hypothetical protein
VAREREGPVSVLRPSLGILFIREGGDSGVVYLKEAKAKFRPASSGGF